MLDVATLTNRTALLAGRGRGLVETAATRLVAPLGDWLTEVSDQADAVWEPFLVDDPTAA